MTKPTPPPASGFIGVFKTREAAQECADRWAYEDFAKLQGLTYVVSRTGDGQRWVVNEVQA